MSWHFSQALEAEFLAGNCLDGERFALWNSIPSVPDDSRSAKMKDTFHRSPFGTMFVPSTDALGVELLTWFRAGFRARTLAQLEEATESTASGPGCGSTWPGSSMKYDPASRSWKTAQFSLLEGLDEFSETWPRWGSTRNMEFWERSTPERRTSETESGLWRTPDTGAGGTSGLLKEGKSRRANGQPIQIRLVDQVNNPRLWPTPTVNDAKNSTLPPSQVERASLVGDVMRSFATPQARDFRTGSRKRWKDPRRTRNLNDQIGGQLNPPWVEWLMGWPIGWTACEPLEMARFQQWPQWHSGFSPDDC